MDVTFVPSLLLNHPYAGQGSLEIAEDGLRISGRRLWPLPVRLVLTLPVAAILYLAGARVALVGVVLLWTLACRSRTTDAVAFSRISDARVLGGRRAQLLVVPEDGRAVQKVVFAGDDVESLMRDLGARLQANPR